MKHFILFGLILSICFSALSKTDIGRLLKDVNKELEKKDIYLLEKYKNINQYTLLLRLKNTRNDLNSCFKINLQLFNEYKSYIYDSAFYYANRTQSLAYKMGDKSKIEMSKINFGFILISAGMFKEAFDTINRIDPLTLPDTISIQYYYLKGLAYFNLIGYDLNSFYEPFYYAQMNRSIDSAIELSKKNSRPYTNLIILKHMANKELDLAQPILEKEIQQNKSDLHSFAMNASSLAYIYYSKGNTEKAISLLAEAIKADVMTSTKETFAAQKLAEILYEQGYTELARKYIESAMDDASYYKTNLRQKQISTILPIIESQQLKTIEKQKRLLFSYSIVITILSILVLISVILIYKHLIQLRQAKNTISATNEKLLELNRIKDEYIGYYFYNNSEYIDKIDKFKKAITRKLVTKRLEDIEVIINNIDPKKERESLYEGFDKIFLKLFPDFIQKFNSLFKDEDKVKLKDNLLNTNLRIFALMRLGITDTDKIAKILDYSVHSIYAYKTKIKNKSIVANELFEQKIMEIKAI